MSLRTHLGRSVAVLALALATTAGPALAPDLANRAHLSSVPSAQAVDPDNNKIAFVHLVKRGLTVDQSAGVVGNLMVESGNPIDPRAVELGGVGRGIAQWGYGTRWTNLVKWAKSQGRDPYALLTQLDFIFVEFDGPESLAGRKLRAATTVTDATLAFSAYYERCGACNNSRRISYANQVRTAYLAEVTSAAVQPAPTQPVAVLPVIPQRDFTGARSLPIGGLAR